MILIICKPSQPSGFSCSSQSGCYNFFLAKKLIESNTLRLVSTDEEICGCCSDSYGFFMQLGNCLSFRKLCISWKCLAITDDSFSIPQDSLSISLLFWFVNFQKSLELSLSCPCGTSRTVINLRLSGSLSRISQSVQVFKQNIIFNFEGWCLVIFNSISSSNCFKSFWTFFELLNSVQISWRFCNEKTEQKCHSI